MPSRTRERLIDVARQLFVRQGIEKTTMNDIATASDRGRRTIYTYFRTKSEIYQAVVETEAGKVLRDLEERVALWQHPADKLRALMEFRISVALENIHGYEVWIKSLFSRDVKRASSVRTMVTDRLYGMIDEIVAEGIASGDFIPAQANRVASMLTMIVRGSDWTVMREAERDRYDTWRNDCINFIIDAIKTPKADLNRTN
ncbi:MAG: TetR/AcrR family transcriptional regulator [Muribaculaceae bacterium]|nr:TetR/AcrR family transcriptional regulator [Muribaculaceae bacterium]